MTLVLLWPQRNEKYRHMFRLSRNLTACFPVLLDIVSARFFNHCNMTSINCSDHFWWPWHFLFQVHYNVRNVKVNTVFVSVNFCSTKYTFCMVVKCIHRITAYLLLFSVSFTCTFRERIHAFAYSLETWKWASFPGDCISGIWELCMIITTVELYIFKSALPTLINSLGHDIIANN